MAGYYPWVEMYPADSIYFIVEDLGDGIQPVAPFSAITFTGLTANGRPLASAGTVNSTNVERGNTPLTKNSSLSGGSFKLSWVHS